MPLQRKMIECKLKATDKLNFTQEVKNNGFYGNTGKNSQNLGG